ncbi:Glycosyltransferase like family 2 [Candidatus Nanopelagicaceae bacterium]
MATSKIADPFHVTAVIVAHDGAIWLPEVVAALSSQSRKIDHVVAVDNGSIDKSGNLLRAAKIPVLTLPRNTGFGDAVYRAVEKLPKSNNERNEWIWVIHDDCAPKSDSLEQLLAQLIDRPNVAMAGPKLLGWHDRSHLLEVGVSITNNGSRWTGLEPQEYDQGQHDGIRDVLSVSTAGALIRRDVFIELGGYDPQLALFRDDVDFGWRIRMAGHSIIVVTDAVAFHAQAAASERRSVDVEGAFLHRPLLLDRRNSAYVLLANSSSWLLPWLIFQLITSAAIRSIGYLIAKLPGYASDEILAIASLVLRPAILRAARKERRIHRLLPPRVIADFIPPRLTQYRNGINNFFESVRNRIFSKMPTDNDFDEEFNDEADLLTPSKSVNWVSVFKRPQVVLGISLLIYILLSSRSRLGSLIGGTLATTPHGTSALWRSYVESWHQVGMGSSSPTPPWVAILSLLSLLFFGKPAVLITVLIFIAPALMAYSAYKFLNIITANAWLRVSSSILYSVSPVAIAGVNTGRLGTLVFLILLPWIVSSISTLDNFEKISWRRIFAVSLLISIATSFTLMAWLAVLVVTVYGVANDFRAFNADLNKEVFDQKLKRRIALLLTPLIVTAPWSLIALIDPSRLLYEAGISLAGGGPNLAFLGNPGGIGALPWWAVSPVTLLLVVAFFASTRLREVAELGLVFLILSVFASSFSIPANGTSTPTQLWAGVFLSVATLAAVTVGTMILNDLRDYLIATNINYRHILSALLLLITFSYLVTATFWSISQASNSPVHTKSVNVLPEYLGVEVDAKTLVLREVTIRERTSLGFYISRGSDIALGEPDVAPLQDPAIAKAVIELTSGSGLSTSKTFADFGIKYLFAKNPIDKDVVRTIDSIGGFMRTSATADGIVWKISDPTGRLFFTDIKGEVTLLASGGVDVTTSAPGPGVITLTENYDLGWQIIQNGLKLERSENDAGLPQFKVLEAGELTLIHDGTPRRAALSLQFIAWTILIILALPAGRRKREISEMELA